MTSRNPTLLLLFVLGVAMPAAVSAAWVRDGVLVSNGSLSQTKPCLASDSEDGVFAAWLENDGSLQVLRLQHVDRDGALRWPSGGLLVAPSAFSKYELGMIADGAGGVIVIWAQSGGATMWAQRLNAAGDPLWGASGVALSTYAAICYMPHLVSDGR